MIKLDLSDECAKLSASPEEGSTDELSVAAITEQLDAAGVCYGVLDEVIDDAVKQVNTDLQAIKDVIVARQLDPQAGGPGTVDKLLADRQVAASGDTIVTIGDATEPVDGKTIFGKPVEATEPSISEPTAGVNTIRVGNEIKAAVYGIVSCSDDAILIEPPVEVDADNMKAFIDIHPRSAVGTPVTVDMIHESLQVAGICSGLSAEGVMSALERAAESDSPEMHQLIAEGSTARKGEDAFVENLVETDTLQGELREDGSVDFHERHAIHNVTAGVIICRRVPPTVGESRVDVYGQSDPPEVGDDVVIQAGENVEKREDEYWATIDGALQIKNNIVSVLDVFSVVGDIDLESGNLHLDKGAVDIRGAVRSGFEVSAASNIMINGLVEDASLESGGDIHISGGILHAEKGSIKAVGNVTAKFAQNANIIAGGDIIISGAAINCNLRSGGEIIVSGGKASFVGGRARARKNIHVSQLGSEAEVVTHVEIGPDEDVIDLLSKALQQLVETEGGGEVAEAEKEALSTQFKAQSGRAGAGASIRIDKKVFPGVSARILNVEYIFTQENFRCKISLDEDRSISVNPLASKA